MSDQITEFEQRMLEKRRAKQPAQQPGVSDFERRMLEKREASQGAVPESAASGQIATDAPSPAAAGVKQALSSIGPAIFGPAAGIAQILAQAPGVPEAIVEKGPGLAKDAAIDFVKEEAARTPSRLLMPMGGSFVDAPAAAMIRSAVSGKTSLPDMEEATKEGLKSAAIETAVGGATELLPVARRPIAALAARMDGNKLVSSLTTALRKAVGAGGSAEAQRQIAGKAIDAAISEAGAEPLAAKGYMTFGSELRRAASQKGAGGLSAAEKEIVAGVDEVTRDGGKMTLDEMHRVIKRFGTRADDLAESNPELARLYREAKNALLGDVETAGGEGVASAMKLYGARKDYAQAMRKLEQSDLLTKAEARSGKAGVDRLIDPAKLANLTGGPERANIERMFRGDPAGLARFQSLADSARVVAEGGAPAWATRVPIAGEKLGALFSAGNMFKVSKDPVATKMLRLALSPQLSAKPEAAAGLIGQVAARIGLEKAREGTAVPATVDVTGLNIAGLR